MAEARKCETQGDAHCRDHHISEYLEKLEKLISRLSGEKKDTLSLRMNRAVTHFALGQVESGMIDVSRIVRTDLIRALEELKKDGEERSNLENEMFRNFLLVCGRRYGEAVLNLKTYEKQQGRPAETHGQIVYASILGHAYAILGFSLSINRAQLESALKEYTTVLDLTLDHEGHPDLEGYVTSKVAYPEMLSGRSDLQGLVERVDPFAVFTALQGYNLISDKLGKEKGADISPENIASLDTVVSAKMDKRDLEAAHKFYGLIRGENK